VCGWVGGWAKVKGAHVVGGGEGGLSRHARQLTQTRAPCGTSWFTQALQKLCPQHSVTGWIMRPKQTMHSSSCSSGDAPVAALARGEGAGSLPQRTRGDVGGHGEPAGASARKEARRRTGTGERGGSGAAAGAGDGRGGSGAAAGAGDGRGGNGAATGAGAAGREVRLQAGQ
jgi:hypothetical protein